MKNTKTIKTIAALAVAAVISSTFAASANANAEDDFAAEFMKPNSVGVLVGQNKAGLQADQPFSMFANDVFMVSAEEQIYSLLGNAGGSLGVVTKFDTPLFQNVGDKVLVLPLVKIGAATDFAGQVKPDAAFGLEFSATPRENQKNPNISVQVRYEATSAVDRGLNVSINTHF